MHSKRYFRDKFSKLKYFIRIRTFTFSLLPCPFILLLLWTREREYKVSFSAWFLSICFKSEVLLKFKFFVSVSWEFHICNWKGNNVILINVNIFVRFSLKQIFLCLGTMLGLTTLVISLFRSFSGMKACDCALIGNFSAVIPFRRMYFKQKLF